MRLRLLACLAILLSCSGCAIGAAGIAADVLAGVSLASMTVTGKGLGDQAISAASGKDCRLVEGMVRSDRGVCEEYKLAAARRPYLVEIPPPTMPAVLIGQPMQAQPAALMVAASSARPAAMPQPAPGMAQPILAAAQQPVGSPTDKDMATAKSDESPAAASAEKSAAATPATAKEPEPPAIVMDADDSMKLAFGSGRSDKEVMAQLHAALAAWRETDKPAPPPPPAEQPAAAAPAQAAEPAKTAEPTKTAEPAQPVDNPRAS